MTVENKVSGEIVYTSCPSRLIGRKDEIMDFVASRGKGGLHPFNALPYKYFEGGVLGRAKSLEICCRLIDICDEFDIYGISEGTLIELEYFLNQNHLLRFSKPLGVYIKEFDEEWQRYYDLYEGRFGMVMAKLKL